MLSSADDLVPALAQSGDGWLLDAFTTTKARPPTRSAGTADIEVFALLGTGATMTSLTVYLTPAPWPPPANPPVPPTPPAPDPGTDAVGLSVQPVYGTSALYGVRPQSTPTAVRQLWWLSIAAADLAEAAAQLEDFFVMFTYSVT
jgi:hypothetical protein